MPYTKKRPGKFLDSIRYFHEKYASKLGEDILEGSFPRGKLKMLAKQFYLQEKWPSHIARVYLALDEQALADRDLVYYILAIIKAENLGVGSKGVPHSVLARDFGLFTGLSDGDLAAARPTTQNRALMDWCDMSMLDRPWRESFAVQIACENQVQSMANIAKGLTFHYGASKEDIQFWLVHGGPIEKKHSKQGLTLLAKHTSNADEQDVLYAYEFTIRLLCEFYNSFLKGGQT